MTPTTGEILTLTMHHQAQFVSRKVFSGPEAAVSLFLTGREIWSLASHFSREQAAEEEEMVIYKRDTE